MSDGIWSAASGAIGQIMALDVAAANVSNASTPAYHGDRAVFREVLTRATAKRQGGFNLKYGAVGTVATDTTAGSFTVTGRPLDVAIKGDGYLVVKTAQGDRYTRHGSLQVARSGNIVTQAGDPLLGLDHRPLKANPDAKSVTISSDGNLFVDGAQSGQLMMVKFANPAGLSKEGAFLLRSEAVAGKPQPTPVELETGAIEGSNVSVVKGMVDIVSASRAFEVCERAIDAFREADRRAAMDVMK